MIFVIYPVYIIVLFYDGIILFYQNNWCVKLEQWKILDFFLNYWYFTLLSHFMKVVFFALNLALSHGIQILQCSKLKMLLRSCSAVGDSTAWTLVFYIILGSRIILSPGATGVLVQGRISYIVAMKSLQAVWSEFFQLNC